MRPVPGASRRAVMEGRFLDQQQVAELERARATLDAIGEALVNIDHSGSVVYINAAAEAITGWSRAEAIGRAFGEVVQFSDGGPRTRRVDAGVGEPHHRSVAFVERALIRRDGTECPIEERTALVHDHLGSVIGEVVLLRDVTAVRALTVRMAHLAHHDLLTGLPNRLLLADRLARALVLADRHQRCVAVLFLDIDRFKHINDSLGHSIGDELLHAVGRELTMCVRSSDTVSRQGGDEFVVVLSELERPEDAAVGAQKIVTAIKRPHLVSGHELHVSVSVGICGYPQDGHDAETLLRNADIALYRAKDAGRDCYEFFRPEMKRHAIERQSIEAELHGALKRGEFVLHCQPKIDLKSGAISGMEALIRWQHPRRGLVGPGQFIAIAEDCGLIAPIGCWVVEEACRQAQGWQDAGLPDIPISVNISAAEFRNKHFVDHIRDILADSRLAPHYLEIEVTETILMIDAGATATTLGRLKDMGVRLAIDDFGTGFSNLSYLNRFPIDALKIDKSFVQQIVAAPSDAPIVSAVIRMAKSLKQRVIAEGVETSDQVAFLVAEECTEGQGFYFSRPMPASQLVESMFLRSDGRAGLRQTDALPHAQRRVS